MMQCAIFSSATQQRTALNATPGHPSSAFLYGRQLDLASRAADSYFNLHNGAHMCSLKRMRMGT